MDPNLTKPPQPTPKVSKELLEDDDVKATDVMEEIREL